MTDEKQAGVTKRFATLTIDAGNFDAPYIFNIWLGGTIVGETTSGGKSIALGMLRSDLHEPGTSLENEFLANDMRLPSILTNRFGTRRTKEFAHE